MAVGTRTIRERADNRGEMHYEWLRCMMVASGSPDMMHDRDSTGLVSLGRFQSHQSGRRQRKGRYETRLTKGGRQDAVSIARSPYVDKSIGRPDAVSEDGNLETMLCMFRQVEKTAKANQIHSGASG